MRLSTGEEDSDGQLPTRSTDDGRDDGGIASTVFCNTNVHNNATKSTELCQLGFSVSTTHA
ncbi:hypothetical protein, partial [Exiguobacterium sp. s141]|uniref:hypothetical protein n=1 Tax=Exiguobacterium sp. s141 TaxID=2751240 RepID=UPI001BEA3BD9